MKARLVKFGEIEVEGKRYTHDVVIDGGKVRKRKKGPSKQFREKFGHTPLSAEEEIPWGGKRLIVGTGAHGALPVMDEVLAKAKRRGIEVIAAPTLEVCQPTGGREEGPGVRHPALHVLTGDLGDRIGLKAWPSEDRSARKPNAAPAKT
jgi:hypothetical protein